jgi:hypothetical protein
MTNTRKNPYKYICEEVESFRLHKKRVPSSHLIKTSDAQLHPQVIIACIEVMNQSSTLQLVLLNQHVFDIERVAMKVMRASDHPQQHRAYSLSPFQRYIT